MQTNQRYQAQRRLRRANRERDLAIYALWRSQQYSLAAIGRMCSPEYPLTATRVQQIIKRIQQERNLRTT